MYCGDDSSSNAVRLDHCIIGPVLDHSSIAVIEVLEYVGPLDRRRHFFDQMSTAGFLVLPETLVSCGCKYKPCCA